MTPPTVKRMRVAAALRRGPWRRSRVTTSNFDAADAYRLMMRMRLVEEALTRAWADGLVPGEYHSGIGEEAINAGVLIHLTPQDSLHLDHRNTAPFIGRGADPLALMLEVLGSERGMNHGMAGHMHLLAPELRTGCDGIVGAGGPLAVGSAVAGAMLRPGSVAVAVHGEAAMNQGMLMEAYNMAVARDLPVVFVCKDNKWSITTYSADVTGGSPVDRAHGFGLRVEAARGDRVEEVHAAAGRLIGQARAGKGPGFLHVTCHRPGGHFEGDPLVRLLRSPWAMTRAWGPGLAEALRGGEGGSVADKADGMGEITKRAARAARDWSVGTTKNPISHDRALLDDATAEAIEAEERAAIEPAISAARDAVADRPVFGTSKGAAR